MIKSEICDMLGISYPVFQGGMAWIADGALAAAVSEGGGLGIIGAGNADGAYVRKQIKKARKQSSLRWFLPMSDFCLRSQEIFRHAFVMIFLVLQPFRKVSFFHNRYQCTVL